MSDVSKFGPLGEGDDSQPLKVDLTRTDIRRGTLNLPRRFYDAFPEGELEANDTVVGRKLTVTFHPPRELEGLATFFEEHELQPNDAVTISRAGGLQLTPVRRERRPGAAGRDSQVGPRAAPPPQYETTSPSPEGERVQVRERRDAPHRDSNQDRNEEEAWGAEQSRVRLQAQLPAQDQPRGKEQSRVRLQAQAPAAYLAPPVPETKGGWQDVLHDPAPRHSQMVRPSERAVAHPDARGRGRVDERREAPADSTDLEQQGLFDGRSEKYGTVREAPRKEGVEQVRAEPRSQAPLAPRVERSEAPPEESPGQKPLAQRQPGMQQAAEESRSAKPSAPQLEQSSNPTGTRVEEEREAVLVGAASAEGDVAGRISRYLDDPATPAIVRATAVAEELRLPLDAVQKGLAEVSRESEGSVAPIRPDVYLVKRSR